MSRLLAFLSLLPLVLAGGHDYKQALSKSILFFEAQRSGVLPRSQRVQWRSNSGLLDGKAAEMDLVGGYYDAGDNVKFGLPMAFTITMMSWSLLEYGKQLGASGEMGHALSAIKWGTDYFIKAHPNPNVLYGQVGDGETDHYCWQRPEEMTTSRTAYRVDPSKPGSDLAGETAAAMAAGSLVFHRRNITYSKILLSHAKQLFEFADKYRGTYDGSITGAKKYYRSVSGYADELLWAAAWLYKASKDEYYLSYLGKNGAILGGTGWAITQFGWDVKYAGVQTIVAKLLMGGRAGNYAQVFGKYKEKADFFMCSCIGKGNKNVQKTPGGLMYTQRWNNMQFVTSAAFLLTIYSDYLTTARKNLKCARGIVAPAELLSFAKSQVDYILGDNPRATSYMVGYGNTFPQHVHHRASSIISYKSDPSFVTCRGGYATWYKRKGNNPNILTGAIVGGPDAYDNFADERENYEQTEPTTYNNAPLVGTLARIHGGHSGYNQLLTDLDSLAVTIPVTPKPAPASKPVQGSSSDVITVEQKRTSSWDDKGKTYYRYSTILTNKSNKTLNDLKLRITKLHGPLWGLAKTGDTFVFPEWLTSLPSRKSLEFVYIHAAGPADMAVTSYILV